MEIGGYSHESSTESIAPVTDGFFLNESEKRFQDKINPHLPALVLDAGGRIQYITRPARQLLEYKAKEHVKGSFFSHVHGKNLYQVMRDVADMVCYGKSSANWLLRLRTGKGRWHWFKAKVQNRLEENERSIVVNLFDVNDL